MKVLELFAGSCSFSNVAKEYGYETFTTDLKQFGQIDYVVDILDFDIDSVPFWPDIIWASPPCTTFSVASCGHHWNAPDDQGNREPKTEAAKKGLLILEQTIWILNELQPKYFIIENPRGLMRKMGAVEYLNRDTVTYCQYGENRMKPTDLWHNLDWTPRPMCKYGMPCHVAAPRGSQTGTQGLKGNYERSKVPYELCKEILEYINNDI
jgi:site-specific DNA-cytosine methylase|tara:strand:+ start:534 stop:1160 length:627 start_codon:yes stop_codon:yes gene_type:complete